MMHQYYPAPPKHNKKWELHKDITIAAAHFVPHESAGKCQRLHGHTYTIDLTIIGDKLNAAGFLVDFRTLKHLIEGRFDHTLINDDALFKNYMPTTETFAEVVYVIIEGYLMTLDEKPTCIQVIVRETPESYVLYHPEKGDIIL